MLHMTQTFGDNINNRVHNPVRARTSSVSASVSLFLSVVGRRAALLLLLLAVEVRGLILGQHARAILLDAARDLAVHDFLLGRGLVALGGVDLGRDDDADDAEEDGHDAPVDARAQRAEVADLVVAEEARHAGLLRGVVREEALGDDRGDLLGEDVVVGDLARLGVLALVPVAHARSAAQRQRPCRGRRRGAKRRRGGSARDGGGASGGEEAMGRGAGKHRALRAGCDRSHILRSHRQTG